MINQKFANGPQTAGLFGKLKFSHTFPMMVTFVAHLLPLIFFFYHWYNVTQKIMNFLKTNEDLKLYI